MEEKVITGMNVRKAIIAAGVICPAIVVGKAWLRDAMMKRSLISRTVGVIGAMGCAAVTGYEAYVWIPKIYDAVSDKLQNHVKINIELASDEDEVEE